MRITSKGQVTIPLQVRRSLGLLPHTEVEFELAGDHARIRPARIRKVQKGKSIRGQSVPSALSGTADAGMSTDEIMALTRGGGRIRRKAK